MIPGLLDDRSQPPKVEPVLYDVLTSHNIFCSEGSRSFSWYWLPVTKVFCAGKGWSLPIILMGKISAFAQKSAISSSKYWGIDKSLLVWEGIKVGFRWFLIATNVC